MSVGLDAVATTTPGEAVRGCPKALLRIEHGGDRPPERDWIDLFAEVARHPLPTLPSARIARLLCRTFGAQACSYARLVDEVHVLGGTVRSDGEQISPWVCDAAGQANAAAVLAMAVWDDLPSPFRCESRLSLPASIASPGKVAFVVGRDTPFRPADRRLAAALWTLLTALHARYQVVAPADRSSATSISLTSRELAVLALLGEGLKAATIARRLQISVRTVHKHLERIYAKLDVTDRLAAVLAARRLGVIPMTPAGR